MTGKRYYMTTLGDWLCHAARFANSHYIVLDAPDSRAVIPPVLTKEGNPAALLADGDERPAVAPVVAAQILVLIEADEGVHLALEDDAAFEPLPHPLAQKPISDAAQAALAAHGVAPGATTFDAAEAVARVHPLLRHRVF
jgi:hypothetical protein